MDCVAEGNSNETDCVLCPQGKYSSISGASALSACRECGAGKYALTEGNNGEHDCVLCGKGKYSSNTGASSQATCTSCPAGKYLAKMGQTAAAACEKCRAGTYAPSQGNEAESSCIDCGEGTYLDSTGKDNKGDCIKCAAGKFSGNTGDMIGASVRQTWGEAGIVRWVRGRPSESCNAVCTTAGLTCNDGNFPQQLSQTVTDALFAQDKTNCYYKYDSTETSAPYFSDGYRCYRATGTSSCSASNSNCSRLCACSNPLLGLVGSIDNSTLETWAAAGVLGWNLGSPGQSCDTVCSNVGLSCSTSSGRFPQQLSQADTRAIFAQSGTYCYSGYTSSDAFAPSIYYGYYCYRGTGTSSCSATADSYARLCACSGTPIPMTGAFVVPDGTYVGASACLDCVAGKYIATQGNSTCALCGKGTYSEATGLTSDSMCTKCGMGKYSVHPGKTSSATCECAPGFFGDMCTPCGLGYYKRTVGSSSCLACPPNSVSRTGSIFLEGITMLNSLLFCLEVGLEFT